MGEEPLQESLKTRFATQRRARLLDAWSLVVGIIAALIAVFVTGALMRFGFPSSLDQWLAVLWALAAWLGVAALLVFGITHDPSSRTIRLGLAGLWIGNLAVAGGVAAYPPSLVILSLPITIGGLMIRRHAGHRSMVVYLLLPILALGSVAMFQVAS